MASYSLGIDLHKKFSYWTLLDHNRDILWQGKVPTNAEETSKAIKQLPVAPTSCTAVIEPVAQWGWYAELLESHGLKVVLANPLQVGLIAKSRLKHDKVDSRILAELLQSGFLPTAYLAPREIRDLRELLRTHICLVRINTRLKNRMHGVLAKHGLQSPASDLFGKQGLDWLGRAELRPIYRIEADTLLRTLQAIKQELRHVDREIKLRARQDVETKILATLPGIGPFTALLIKAEVGYFERFRSPVQLTSYAGLVASSHSSGGKLRYGRITKQGSVYIRWAMVQAAARVNPRWGRLWSFYHRLKSKKGNKIARVALARKLLVIGWYLVKKKEPFRVLELGNSGGVRQ